MGNALNNRKYNKDSKVLKNRLEKYTLKNSLKNIELFKNNMLIDDNTIVYRQLENKHSSLKFCLVFVDGMVNNEIISKPTLETVINGPKEVFNESLNINLSLYNCIVTISFYYHLDGLGLQYVTITGHSDVMPTMILGAVLAAAFLGGIPVDPLITSGIFALGLNKYYILYFYHP